MLKRAAVSALVAVALSGASQPATKDAEKAAEDKRTVQSQSAKDDKRGTEEAPLVVEVTNPPNGDAIAEEIKNYAGAQAQEGRETFVLNCLLVGVGMLQGAALIYTALVSNKAANAAKTAAEVIPVMERPYVFLHEMRPDLFGTQHYTSGAAVTVVFHNHGRTPANIAVAKVITRFLDHVPTPADEPSVSDKTNDLEKITIERVIGAGKNWEVDPPSYAIEKLDHAQSEQFRAGQMHLYCWGEIRYRDIFGKEHPTVFCRRLDLKRHRFDPVGGWDRNQGT
jgi:hypothetical protein